MRILKPIIFVALFVTGPVMADPGQEIDHLLEYVRNTDCQYDRNGTIYIGSAARDHINMKYEYYKDEVKTAEDFIKYAATKSKMSGKKYRILCPGSDVEYASDWLLDELESYRKNQEK